MAGSCWPWRSIFRLLLAAGRAGGLTVLALGVACAQGESWRPLFNGSDLDGWEVVGGGDWQVEDGELVARRRPGERKAGWLVSREDFSDFKLRLKFRSKLDRFNSGILLRDPGHAKRFRPAFNGYEIQIQQGTGEGDRNTTGAIYDLSRAYPLELKPSEWALFEAHCIGNRIVSFANGKAMAETAVRRSRRGAVGLQLHGGDDPAELRWKDIEILELPAAAPDFQLLEERLEQAPGEFIDLLAGGGVRQLFDTYWDGGARWSLRNGVLRGEKPAGIGWIFTKSRYADFVLAFEYRASRGGNGGVGFRFPWQIEDGVEQRPAYAGFECQISERDALNPTGSLYNRSRAYVSDLWRKPIHRPGRWNQGRIYAQGERIVVYINRRKTADIRAARSASGRIGFQIHEPTEWIEYRNVRVKEIR